MSLADPEVLNFLINERGYVVFRIQSHFRPKLRVEGFSNGKLLPQPFRLVSRTTREDWDEQCLAYQKKFGPAKDAYERRQYSYFRVATD